MALNFLDIEASGLDPRSYPIEIAILIDGVELHDWLIRPKYDWKYWDERAERDIHKISRKELWETGIDAEIVANELNRLIGAQIIYSDAQYWDEKWVSRLFSDTRIKQQFEVHPIQDLMSPNRAKRFNHIKSQLAESGAVKHRAKEDVLQLAQLAKRFIGGDLRS